MFYWIRHDIIDLNFPIEPVIAVVDFFLITYFIFNEY